MNPMQLGLNTRVVRSQGQVSTEVDGQIMLLSIERGSYFALADTGARIWALLEEASTVGEVCQRLQTEYDVDAQTCEREVLAFLRTALEESLVGTVEESAGG